MNKIVYGFSFCPSTIEYLKKNNNCSFKELDNHVLSMLQQALDRTNISTPQVFIINEDGEHEYEEPLNASA